MYRFSLILMTILITLAFAGGCAKKGLEEEAVAEPVAVAEPEVEPVTEPVVEPVAAPVEEVVEVNTFRLDANALKTVFFGYDSADLSAEAEDNLKGNAELLRFDPEFRVTIAGHCDERGSDEYNMSLGERRAQTVMSYLASLGIDESRLNVVSFGEEQPEVRGSDEISWAMNRRVEFN